MQTHLRTPAWRRSRSLVLAVLFALAAVGCSSASPYTSFDPTAPCTADGRFPGAYPDLEARVPKQFDGRAADQLDSGRNCSETEMGTLATHGIKEVQYAGGTWLYSSNAGVTLALFTGQGLTAEWLGEWYESGARSATNTRNIAPTRPTIAGRPAYRLDTVNGDSNQVVITWQSASGDAVYVLVAADIAEAKITEALATFP